MAKEEKRARKRFVLALFLEEEVQRESHGLVATVAGDVVIKLAGQGSTSRGLFQGQGSLQASSFRRSSSRPLMQCSFSALSLLLTDIHR